MQLLVLTSLGGALAKALLLSAILFLVCSIPFVLGILPRTYQARRRVRQKLEVLEKALQETEGKLLIATELATSHYRLMTKASDLALFSLRHEILRLSCIRDEARQLLDEGRSHQVLAAEKLLESSTYSPEVITALRTFFRPTVVPRENEDYAGLKRLMTFALFHVKLDANV